MMKRNRHNERGAILVESALVVGAVFLMLFGTVYLAMIGFDQMSADGAAFEVAHQASVGASAAPQAAHTDFPGIPQSQITTTALAAPSPGIPVDYGYNGTASEQAGSDTDRHGGVSMLQAQQLQGQATKVSASLLGHPISVVGQMIEPVWLENGLHFNADNTNNYGGTSADSGFQGNALTQGENAPPYYVGFNFIQHCQGNMPFDMLYVDNYAKCPASEFTPLGVAEFLDQRNWCSSAGTGPPCDIVQNGIAGSQQKDGTFALISCHQRVYAAIAKFFVNNPVFETLYGSRGTSNPFNYYWTVNPSNTFTTYAGLDSTPGSMSTADSTPDGITDNAVRTVYGWDGTDIIGTPAPNTPTNYLNPGKGC